MPDGPPNPVFDTKPLLDYRGERDDRTWYMREKVLEDALLEMRQERDFLREMLRLVLANQDGGREE